MGFFSGVKRFFKPFVDISSWGSFNQLKKQTDDIKGIAEKLFTTNTAKRHETFEEALARLNLTENDIQQRIIELKRLTLIFVLFIIMLMGYLIYLILHQAWIGSVACTGIIFAIAGQTFRYHFWLFQIKQRRLGCTLQDWFYNLFGIAGRKK